MNPKAWEACKCLNKIKKLDRKIQILTDEIAQLEAAATRITAVIDKLGVQTAPENHKEDAIIRYVDSTKQLARLLQTFQLERSKILSVLMQLPNPDHIDILYKRYFEFKKWEQICDEMARSSTWIFDAHAAALMDFYAYHEKRSKKE